MHKCIEFVIDYSSGTPFSMIPSNLFFFSVYCMSLLNLLGVNLQLLVIFSTLILSLLNSLIYIHPYSFVTK